MSDRETSRHAVTALTFAVLGWTLLPLLGALLALLYAGRADRAIRRQPDWIGGTEMAAAARSLAHVWFVCLLLLLVVGLAIGIALGLDSSEFQ